MQLNCVSYSVDAKINTLDSEGKCSSSFEKSTKRASQFDLQLTSDKQKSNSRAYRLGFRISLTQAYRLCRYKRRQKNIKCQRVVNMRVGRISRCEKRQDQLVVANCTYITKSKLRMCNSDDTSWKLI